MQHLAHARRLCSFVCPQAPPRFMPIQGATIPSWFVIREAAERRPEFLERFEESRAYVQKLVKSLQPLNRRVLIVGYSMGAALGIASAFTIRDQPVWGVLGLSGYTVPLQVTRKSARKTRFWAGHSPSDTQIPFEWAAYSFQSLKGVGVPDAHFEVFDKAAGHEFGDEHRNLLVKFVQRASLAEQED